MAPKWIIALATLFLAGTIISGILEQSYLGSADAGMFHDLLSKYKELSWNFLTIISVAWSYIVLVWRMFWWDYSFWYGSWEIIRFFCWTISIGIIVSLILSITRGTSSG
jgi:hypothetical protein